MTHRMRAGIALLVLARGLTGCGGSGSKSTLSAPSPVTQPASPLNAAVTGKVVDTADRPIGGAIVEVVDGPQAGMSATSGVTGDFYLPGPFDDTTLFRATKEGHIAATQSWRRVSPGQPGQLIFYLGVLGPSVNIAGDYTLTFVADGRCAAAIPADLRTRTYAATITATSGPNYPANTRFIVAASGAPFESIYNWFSVGVAGDYLAFWLGDEHLIEEIATNTYLELHGAAVAGTTSGASTISASFDGTFNYCKNESGMDPFSGCSYSPESATHSSCASHNHQLVLTRR